MLRHETRQYKTATLADQEIVKSLIILIINSLILFIHSVSQSVIKLFIIILFIYLFVY